VRGNTNLATGLSAALLLCLLTGCTRDGRFQAISMWNESRLKPLEESPALAGTSSSATLVPGSVARGEAPADAMAVSGRAGGKLTTRFPYPITEAVVKRGQERFNVYCSPCHGRLGDGQGMIVKRGFPPPPDYAIPRLRNAPVGHFYDVITNGYGAMYSYASRVPPNDRWAIAAYIRALQATRPVVSVELDREKRLRARDGHRHAAGRREHGTGRRTGADRPAASGERPGTDGRTRPAERAAVSGGRESWIEPRSRPRPRSLRRAWTLCSAMRC